ncbi:hypothetical protein ACFVYD_28255 [Streptomyces sp. NPDC058301]|uniref:hypothetical protein n=1 Tax=Streptomyces sp. NPDC058301 TaxID=3346436 RepID=UPI0036EE2F4A
MEDLKRRLRDAAAAHEPDRDAMLARVRHGMSRSARPNRRATGPLSWPRVTVATLASAAALVAGGYAIATTVHTGGPGREVAAVPAAPSPPPTSGHASPPSTPPTSGHAPTPSTPPTSGHASPPSTPPHRQDGPLRSDISIDSHTNAYWAQSNITLQTGVPLGTLTLEVRIVQTGGVASTGAWRTLPAGDFTLTTTNEGDALRYRWTLKPGRTVLPGKHVFAVQYNHASGPRAATADTYTATATTAKGQRYTVTGRCCAAPSASG